MKEVISKELLGEALGVNIYAVDGSSYIIAGSDTLLHYTASPSVHIPKSINIYELAHKCKEWAFKTHNKIISSEVSVEDWVSVVAHFYGNLRVHIEESFSGATEPEAIFEACQWILDNKDKQ